MIEHRPSAGITRSLLSKESTCVVPMRYVWKPCQSPLTSLLIGLGRTE